MTARTSPFRTDLIVPVEWQGQIVHALTIEGLSDLQIDRIHAARRVRSNRKALRLVVSIATECPLGLTSKLLDRDLERATDMVTLALTTKAMSMSHGG